MPEPGLTRRKPAGFPTAVVARVMVIGPVVVVRMMLGGSVIGRTSPAARPRVEPATPVRMTLVLAGAPFPITAMARVMVLNAQLGVEVVAARPLPVAV